MRLAPLTIKRQQRYTGEDIERNGENESQISIMRVTGRSAVEPSRLSLQREESKGIGAGKTELLHKANSTAMAVAGKHALTHDAPVEVPRHKNGMGLLVLAMLAYLCDMSWARSARGDIATPLLGSVSGGIRKK